MREIKFRAWDKEKKSMWYGGYVVFSMPLQTDITDLHQTKVGKYPRGDSVLMQYTGLKDKNGKEIYEGDILASRQHGTGILVNFFSVEWRESEAGWHPFADNERNCGCCGSGENPEWFEVIGNIYENEDLLANKDL